jgi:hypothetical protein
MVRLRTRSGRRVGMLCGRVPNIQLSWPTFWSRSETPIAVIKTLMRGALRRGLYARRSRQKPTRPHVPIARTRITPPTTASGRAALLAPRATKTRPIMAHAQAATRASVGPNRRRVDPLAMRRS